MAKVSSEFPDDVPDQPELAVVEREGDLVWITIDRPEVMNCLSFATLKRLRTVWSKLGLVERELDSALVYLAASIAFSTLVGIAVYYLVEVPLLRFFRGSRPSRRTDGPLPAGAPGAAN